MSSFPTHNETGDRTRRLPPAAELLDEIAQLSQLDILPEAYFHQLLARVVAGLESDAGAIWELGTDGSLRLVASLNLAFESDSHATQLHVGIIQKAAASGDAQVVLLHAADTELPADDNVTGRTLLLAHVRHDKRVQLIIEVRGPADADSAALQGSMRWLQHVCGLVAERLNARTIRQLQHVRQHLVQQDRFVRLIHTGLDARRTAFIIANESRRILDCDRVSVAIRKGRRCVIQAVSGQDTLEQRSGVIALLNRLVQAIVATGESFWYATDCPQELAPQLEGPLQTYVDETFVKAFAVIPLRAPADDKETERDSESRVFSSRERGSGDVIGALVVEQIGGTFSNDELGERVEAICAHSEQALANSLAYSNLFLMPLWRLLGKVSGLPGSKALLVVALISLGLLSLILIPTDFKLRANGTLKPSETRDVFALVKGVVDQVHVESGDAVQEGQLLLELRNPELSADLEEKLGERRAVEKQLNVIEETRLRTQGLTRADIIRLEGEQLQLQIQLRALSEELRILDEQRETLKVKSPITGIITTWNVDDLLGGRPVAEGQLLLTVVDPQREWKLELYMPEKRIDHVVQAQRRAPQHENLKVTYVLRSDPGVTREGVVQDIQPATEMHEEEGHAVRIRVAIDKDHPRHPMPEPRPGTTVIAHVHCGRCSIGYQWLHEAYDTVQRAWFSIF